MTHNINAENEPRKAITELKFGTRLDIPTESNAKTMRSMMTRMRLKFGCLVGSGPVVETSVFGR